MNTGNCQLSIEPTADDLNDTAAVSSELPYRCTPARSAPATNRSELRASAWDVSRPPYERPQIPIRDGSTSDRVCKYFPAARTSWYSDFPRASVFAALRKARP